MQEYGIDTITPIDLRYDIGKDMLFIRNGDLMLDTAMREGLKGPVPVHVSGIFELYQKYTGKSSGQAKAKVAMQPEAFFYASDRACRQIRAGAKGQRMA